MAKKLIMVTRGMYNTLIEGIVEMTDEELEDAKKRIKELEDEYDQIEKDIIEDVIKAVMVGADVANVCSVLLSEI